MKPESSSQLSTFWENHIKLWKETTLSQAAYCQEHDLHVHRFGYWKRKLINSDTKPASSQEQGFIQLNPISPHPATSSPAQALAVQLPNQLRIEGITPDTLYLAKELAGLLQ